MADLDCTNSLQPCACTANQICVQIGRSSTECAKNTCIEKQSSGDGNGNNGKNSVGAVAGQAIGGVIGGLVIIVAVYWFWWRRRKGANTTSSPRSAKSSSSPPSSSTNNKGLREFRMGNGQKEHQEKHYNVHPDHYRNNNNNNITSPPGPGEEDAKPVKRQSLRFDSSNHHHNSLNRRSLSNTHNNASMLPSSTPISTIGGMSSIAKADNPFGDHHNVDSDNKDNDNDNEIAEELRSRQSAATISEFSFRSSHSTNIIPIAYIPAHSTQNSTIDMTALRGSINNDNDSRRPHSVSTMGGGGGGHHHHSAGERGSRASVPLSLRSASTGGGGMPHDSMMSAGSGNGIGSRMTFSNLFDRRTSMQSLESSGANGGGGGGLEIIASTHLHGQGKNSPTPPAVTTPTFTKDGRPIRPPRAPGLDLKLPTPDAISSSPTSPGFPWNNNGNNGSRATSPGQQQQQQQQQQNLLSPLQAHFPAGTTTAAASNRETLLSPARASAYSTFSQATGSSGSHLSYILEAPQIVTPVSAGGVQVQTLARAAARTVKLPQSGGTGSLSPHVTTGLPMQSSPLHGSASPTNAQLGIYPTSPNPQYIPSPLSSSRSRHDDSSLKNDYSPSSDNPFDDEAAVKIAIPSSQEGTPVLPLTPTFGTSPMHTPLRQDSRPGTSNDHHSHSDNIRESMTTTSNGRRGSDLSIFTSTDVQHDDYDDYHHHHQGGRRTVRNSFASSTAASTFQRQQSGRRPSPSSFVGTAGHSAGSNQSVAPSIASTSTSMADEVILSPPHRPFAMNNNNNGAGAADSRHNSAALSTRSGYASVLDGIPFNLSLSPEARHSQASDAGGPVGLRESIPIHFAGDGNRNSSNSNIDGSRGGGGNNAAGLRDSTATYRTSVASSSAHTNDKRDTSYSLASEWNGAFAGMPIVMGGGIGEEAVPELPSMYQQGTGGGGSSAMSRLTTTVGPSSTTTTSTQQEQQHQAQQQEQDQQQRDMRYSTDSLALAAAVARQFDERED